MGGFRARLARWSLIALPLLWLVLFFAVPFAIVARISLSEQASARPPYAPQFDPSSGIAGLRAFFAELDLETYARIFTDELYVSALLASLFYASVSTVILILIGFPFAWMLTRAPARFKPVLIALVILPFWSSFLIRVYAWIGILKPEGLLNALLLKLGVISAPLTIINTDWAVLIGIVYTYFPFMVLPLYAVLDKLDDSLLEAAADLGAPPRVVFLRVVLPLALPGLLAGALLVFIPALGEFVIPELLGSSETLTIGQMIYKEMFSNRDWPMGSAIAVVLLVMILLALLVARAGNRRRGTVGAQLP